MSVPPRLSDFHRIARRILPGSCLSKSVGIYWTHRRTVIDPWGSTMHIHRRHFLAAGAAAPLVLASRTSGAAGPADDMPPPRYQLAMNLEIMFAREMPYE